MCLQVVSVPVDTLLSKKYASERRSSSYSPDKVPALLCCKLYTAALQSVPLVMHIAFLMLLRCAKPWGVEVGRQM